jgi:predicted dehydrogenase
MNKVAVVGAGNWGKNLVRNFHSLGALGAIVDPNPALRETLGAEYTGIPIYGDCAPLWDSDVSAVAIATPVPTHYSVAREALLAGKDVFVEKPLTLSVREAEELVALAEQRGKVLMVGHLLLYQPAVQWIRSYIESGKLGEVYSLHQKRLNLGRARAVENALWSLGVHDVAVLLYLVGSSPTLVRASGQRVLQRDVEDDVHLHLEFPRGVQAHLQTSWLWPEKQRQLVVVGSQGMLVYHELDQTVTRYNKGIHGNLESWDDGQELVFGGAGEPLRLEVEHFLARLADRALPLSDGKSGVEVVRVLEQAIQLLTHQADSAWAEPSDRLHYTLGGAG